MRRFWVAWLGAWESVNFDHELRDAGQHVLALIEQRMHGSEEIELSQRHAQLWTFKGDEVVRWNLFWDPREALLHRETLRGR